LEKIIVRGGQRLKGTVKVEGAKNAVLPVIAATLLASKGKCEILDVPELSDVYTINEVLRYLNADVDFENNRITVDATKELNTEAPFEYVRKMRASVLVMGALLARNGSARVALPGGSAIGSRPIDQHLKGFEAMGATVEIGNGFIEARIDGRLKGAKIYLDFPSVGATENIMMAAVLAKGTTVIENVAKEPEIVDLANFLNEAGACVRADDRLVQPFVLIQQPRNMPVVIHDHRHGGGWCDSACCVALQPLGVQHARALVLGDGDFSSISRLSGCVTSPGPRRHLSIFSYPALRVRSRLVTWAARSSPARS
jgi:hypothetical protein